MYLKAAQWGVNELVNGKVEGYAFRFCESRYAFAPSLPSLPSPMKIAVRVHLAARDKDH
jgi:hypothetical protein